MPHVLHLQRKRQEYLQPIQQPKTTNLLAKYAMEGAAAGFAFHQVWLRCIPLWLLY
jgi:hypothetical protein